MLQPDVVIIGAGIAGCAAALQLRREGAAVGMISRRAASGVRIAEVLVSEAREILFDLGVWSEFVALDPPRVPGRLSCWGSDRLAAIDHIFDPHGDGWVLERPAFDHMLIAATRRRGVQLWEETAVGTLERAVDGWRVMLARGDVLQAVACRAVIIATGRSFLPMPGARQRRRHHDRLVAVALRALRPPDWPDGDHRPLIEAVEDGWWYSIMAPDRHVDLAFMTDAARAREMVGGHGSRLAVLQTALRKTLHTIERLGGPLRPVGTPRICSANSYQIGPVAGRGVATVGDAAMAIDPLSGQGTYLALTGGMAAANAVIAYLHHREPALEEYARQIDRRFSSLMRDKATIYGAERRWRSSPFWQSRQAASEQRTN